MQTRSALADKIKALAAGGTTRDALVAFLRAEGCSKADSTAVLREALNVSLQAAHELVHLSTTWRDVRDRDDKMMEMLEDVLREKGYSPTPEKERR